MFKRFSLQTFLLLVAVAGIAIAYFSLSQQIAELKSKLQPLRVVSNSLIIDDPEQIAIARDPGGSVIYHLKWQVYLPPVSGDESFVLCLAQDPNSKPELPPVDGPSVKKFPIPSGTHEISFMARDKEERPCVYELKLNGELLQEFQYQTLGIADWEVFVDSSTVQQPAEQPLILCPTSWTANFESYLWIQKQGKGSGSQK